MTSSSLYKHQTKLAQSRDLDGSLIMEMYIINTGLNTGTFNLSILSFDEDMKSFICGRDASVRDP